MIGAKIRFAPLVYIMRWLLRVNVDRWIVYRTSFILISNKKPEKNEKSVSVTRRTPRLGLEPRSKAPEASRISSTLPGQPYLIRSSNK